MNKHSKRLIAILLTSALLAPSSGLATNPPQITVSKSAAQTQCEEVQITLNAAGVGDPQVTRAPLDVMIVLDRSGSMWGNPNVAPDKPLNDAKNAAKQLIDQLDPSMDKIGLASFSTTAALDIGLTNNFTNAKTAIDSLNSGGWTNIGGGILTAHNEINTNRRQNAIPIIVLLSDGASNITTTGTNCDAHPTASTTCTEEAINQAQTAKNAGITIFSIYLHSPQYDPYPLTDALARADMQTIASGPEYYYDSPTSDDLSGIFTEIAEKINNIAGSEVKIVEVLPTGIIYIPGSASIAPTSITGQTLTWDLGLMIIGDTKTISLKAQVTNPGQNVLVDAYPDARLEYKNYQAVVTTVPFPETRTNITSCRTQADLAVTKSITAGTAPYAGDTVKYRVTLKNNGPHQAQTVTLKDQLPAGLTYVSHLTSGTNAGTYNPLTGFWSISALDVNAESVLEINATVNSGTTGQIITNISSDAKSDLTDPNLVNNSAQASLTVGAKTIDLSITKTGPTTGVPGQTLTYDLNYKNNGNGTATGVVITETVPVSTVFASAASTNGWTCADGAVAGTKCLYNISSVTASQSAVVKFAIKVNDKLSSGVTKTTNTATITDDLTHGADSNLTNNTTSVDTNLDAAPDLKLTKSDADAKVAPGSTVIYTLTYENIGNQEAQAIVINETVPVNTTFNLGQSTSGWTCANGAVAGTACKYNAPSLPAGQKADVKFAVTALATIPSGVTKITNTATIADNGQNGADPTPANNTATDETPIDQAKIDLELKLTASKSSPAVHESFNYYLEITNKGPLKATGVQVKDVLPKGIYLDRAVDNYLVGIWTVGEVNAGEKKTLTLPVYATNELAITNSAEVFTAVEPDVDSTPNNGVTTEDDYSAVTVTVQSGGCTGNCGGGGGGGGTFADLTPPMITINPPTKKSYNPITDTTIIVTDDQCVSTANVSATGGTISCTQINGRRVECTSVISQSGNLKIEAKDCNGLRAEKTEYDYQILAVGGGCDLNCEDLEYDVYIINPNGEERHMYTKNTIIDGNDGVLIVHFEDKGENQKADFDYNDIVMKIDTRDCSNAIFTAIDGNASWHHQIRARVFYQGSVTKDVLLFADSHTARKQRTSINVNIAAEMCSVIYKEVPLTPLDTTGRAITNQKLYQRIKGKILLLVQRLSEPFYIHPSSQVMYNLGQPNQAFTLFKEHAVGITNANLNQIPFGLETLTGVDSDRDGLPDTFEDAINTNKLKADTDGDGFNDRQELENGYSPSAGNGAKLSVNQDYGKRQAGRIFMQIENKGQIWYVSTAGKRYLVGNSTDMAQIINKLGVGISNEDFAALTKYKDS